MFPAEESTDVYISTSSPALSSISSILPLSFTTSSSSLSTPLKTVTPTTKTISSIFNINSNPISILIPNQSISSSSSLSSIKLNQKKEIKSAQAIGTKDIVIDIPTLSSTISKSQLQSSSSSSSSSINNNINTTILQTLPSPSPSSSYLTEESLIEKSLSLPSIISTLSSSKIIPTTIQTTTQQATTVTRNNIKINRINNNEEKQSYHYKCIPPPLFVILVSVIEIAVFLYESWFVKINEFYNDDDNIPVPSDSILVYRPDRRQEIWRFFSYMVLHANWFHLSFNVITQLIFGIPLELVHGSVRIGCIYLAGVFAGSLGTSVVDTKVYLCGASGGVYALLGAHLANILLNYKKINYIKCKLFLIILFSLCDIGFALYTRYFQNHDVIINISINTNHGIINSNFVSHNMNNTMPPISYIAHLSGVLAGLTIGLLVLRNFVLIENPQNHKIKSQNNLLWWTALGIYMAFLIFTITFNIMNTMTAQILEEKSQIIKQYLFHNLGGSS